MRHISDEEMFKLVDGEYAAAQQQDFQIHIDQCPACKTLYTEIASLDSQLQQIILERPSVAFTERLMEKWQAAPEANPSTFYMRSYSLIMAPIAFVFGLVLILLSAVSLGGFRKTTLPVTGSAGETNYDLSSLQGIFQYEILVNSFLIINAILALLILDKVVLQPYFNKKMKQMAG